VAIDVHDVAYEVLVSRVQEFTLNSEISLFTYEAITQDDHYLVGFLTSLEKDAFMSAHPGQRHRAQDRS
jgi:Holliday junction resolvasome RuvABC DNA-binding subunit